MSIGSIEFLTLSQSKSSTTSAPTFKFTFDDDDEVFYCMLSVKQMNELRNHIGHLLIETNALPAESAPSAVPTVPVVKTFGIKGAPVPVKAAIVESDDEDLDEDDLDGEGDAPRQAKTAMKHKGTAVHTPYRAGPVVPHHIGTFADKVANNRVRDPRRIATRVLEEVVELVLATGATTQMVYAAVADSIHNQALKASVGSGRTVFPSQLSWTFNALEVQREIADVRLVLLDLMWVTKSSENRIASEMSRKLRMLLTHRVGDFASDGHTFYLKKPHVETQATSL